MAPVRKYGMPVRLDKKNKYICTLQYRLVFPVAVLSCIITLVAGCATSGGPNVERPVDDITITKAIKSKMSAYPELSRLNIKVESRQGEVSLSGTVPSREIETRLIKLALSVQGVKSVKDDITAKKQP